MEKTNLEVSRSYSWHFCQRTIYSTGYQTYTGHVQGKHATHSKTHPDPTAFVLNFDIFSTPNLSLHSLKWKMIWYSIEIILLTWVALYGPCSTSKRVWFIAPAMSLSSIQPLPFCKCYPQWNFSYSHLYLLQYSEELLNG